MSTVDAKAGETGSGWIRTTWEALEERSRDMLIRRGQGQTLEEIGDAHGVSRSVPVRSSRLRRRPWLRWPTCSRATGERTCFSA